MSDHVALFVPSLAKAGGVERVVVNLATGLHRREYEVEIVTGSSKGPFAADVPRGVQITEISAPQVPLVGIAGAIPGLVRYLRRRRPDVLLSSMNHVNVPAIVAHGLARTDTQLIVSEHNNPTLLLSEKNPNAGRDKLVYRAARTLYPHADTVVAVSDGVAADLASIVGLDEDDVDVIYNPVVSSRLEQDASEPADHPWFDEDVPVILAAKPEAQKNLALLVRAFARVRETTEARLLVVGQGEQRAELAALARELNVGADVEFAGFVENIYAYMNEAALFALSSNWEGLPTVLIEALGCGCPVVSTNCPSGPAEILVDGEYGSLVPVGDVEAMADALRSTIEEPPSEALLRERAAAFSIEAAVDGYETVLR